VNSIVLLCYPLVFPPRSRQWNWKQNTWIFCRKRGAHGQHVSWDHWHKSKI